MTNPIPWTRAEKDSLGVENVLEEILGFVQAYKKLVSVRLGTINPGLLIPWPGLKFCAPCSGKTKVLK